MTTSSKTHIMYSNYPMMFNKENLKPIVFYFSASLTGAVAIVSQVIFLRELLSTFYGNELIYGITLSIWVVFTALGAAIFGKLSSLIKNSKLPFIFISSVMSLILPYEIHQTRIIKQLMGLPYGELPTLSSILLATAIILAPITILIGFQFSMGSKMLLDELGGSSKKVGAMYIMESGGAVIGGLTLSYVLLGRMNSFQIASLLFSILFAAAISMLMYERSRILRWTFTACVLMLLVLNLFSLTYYGSILNFRSERASFGELEFINSSESSYGKTDIVRVLNEYTFYHDGHPLLSSADLALNEEVAHLTLLEHKRPKSVLVIGGSPGLLKEMLKHRLDSIDYVDADPNLIAITRQYIGYPQSTLLRIIPDDGRSFINHTDKKYDIIMVNLPDPGSAFLNRFYTREFFVSCKAHLNRAGMFSLHLESSESYMGSELRLLNASINKTLNEVFTYTIALTSNYTYFFCSNAPYVITKQRAELLDRWRVKGISTVYFKPFVVWFELNRWQLEYTAESVKYDSSTKINTDLQPVAYYYNALFWLSQFDPRSRSFFERLANLDSRAFLFFFIPFPLIAAYKRRSRIVNRFAIPLSVALVGFAGMTMNVIGILSFQSIYGYVYSSVAILIASFMAGLAAGGFISTSLYEKVKRPAALMKVFLLLLALYSLGISWAFVNFSGDAMREFLYDLSGVIFPCALLLYALPIGAIFPLAIKAYEKYNPKIGSLSGTIYGADLIGGAVSGILTSVLFVPIFGIVAASYICLGAILAAFILLA